MSKEVDNSSNMQKCNGERYSSCISGCEVFLKKNPSITAQKCTFSTFCVTRDACYRSLCEQ